MHTRSGKFKDTLVLKAVYICGKMKLAVPLCDTYKQNVLNFDKG